MKNSNVIGIDLAKNVIQVCIIDKYGELLSNKAISPSKYKNITGESNSVNRCNGSLWCLSLLGQVSSEVWARCSRY